MKNNLVSESTIAINAPVSNVWNAITSPELIKQYLFGTEVTTDWKAGSPIVYKGSWNGKTYEDKGIILKVIPEKLLESTYWSSMGGLPDKPKNYKKLTYELSTDNKQTTLTISNDNNQTEKDRDHSKKNWDIVLNSLKQILEK